jgi:excisionase family DNA binding protein
MQFTDFAGSVRLLLTKDEAAKALGISLRMLTGLMARKQIKGHFRLGRRVVFSRAALEAWIAEMVNSMGFSGQHPPD